MTDLELAAEFVGMTPAELREALKRKATCPLCIETDGKHNPRICKIALIVMADRCADAKNSVF